MAGSEKIFLEKEENIKINLIRLIGQIGLIGRQVLTGARGIPVTRHYGIVE